MGLQSPALSDPLLLVRSEALSGVGEFLVVMDWVKADAISQVQIIASSRTATLWTGRLTTLLALVEPI